MVNFPLSNELLLALAPSDLAALRTERYGGQGISVSLASFNEHDRNAIEQLYHALLALRETLAVLENTVTDTATALRRAAQNELSNELLSRIRSVNVEAYSHLQSNYLGAVIHDIRGGALQALAIHGQLVALGLGRSEDLTRMFLLTRDHLKIMRNCIPDLDPELYARDRTNHEHSVELLVEKWGQTTYRLPDHNTTLYLDCHYSGNVSERCIEFAALDRVLYNLMNNASRNSADQNVYLSILPVPADSQQNIRFVVYNKITPEHEQLLNTRYGQQLGSLFQGGFTTGGSGQGMRICADFVTNAYGLHSVDEALSGGYIGAICKGGYFVNWVHWPSVPD